MKELLRDLVALPGCGAFEQPVGRYIAERAGRRADGVQTDGLGNVIAWKQGGRPGPTVMLSAHMDEVGFMVRKIEPSGLRRRRPGHAVGTRDRPPPEWAGPGGGGHHLLPHAEV